MATNMAEWFAKFKDAISAPAREAEMTRTLVEEAWRRRVRIELRGKREGDRPSRLATTLIEEVSANDLVIAQPMAGRAVRPLFPGEELEIAFTLDRGRYCAETRALGRITLPSGAAGSFYGYRIALPTAFNTAERRGRGRVSIGFDTMLKVHLVALERFDPPLTGVVHDLGTGGCRVRSREARGRVGVGDRFVVHVTVPDTPPVAAPATVTHVRPGRNPEDTLIGLRFDSPLEQLQAFVRNAEERRRRRFSA